MKSLLALLLLALIAGVASAQDDDFGYEGYIVGGEVANIASVPYQVSLELQKAHHCGGSILTTSWVLTAAHCVYGQHVGLLQVRAGTDKLQTGGSVCAVRNIVVHPKYSMQNGQADWDVALVHLALPLVLGTNVKAVRLPASGKEPPTNTPVVASGWGLTTAQPGAARSSTDISIRDVLEVLSTFALPLPLPPASLPSQLRKVTVRITSRKTCTDAYSKTVLSDRMICAAAPGKDTCTYDSGGPLVDSAGVQVGVVSWGRGCADPKYPGVYVHLGNADVRSFVKSNAGV